MSIDFIEVISKVQKLKQSSAELTKIKESKSSDEFSALVVEFEKEVDKLCICLADTFDQDPDVMQMIYELKSVVIALRAENVERVS